LQGGAGVVLAVLAASFVVGMAVATVAGGPASTPQATLPAAAVEVLRSPPRPSVPQASLTPETGLPTPSTSEAPDDTPTPAVTPRPEPTLPATPAGPKPAEVVLAFYVAVATHDWDTATALWSPEMQRRYPPAEDIVARFSATERIHINLIDTVERSGDTARVAVTLLEYRTTGPSPQRFVGAWDLVRIDGQWVLDDPDF